VANAVDGRRVEVDVPDVSAVTAGAPPGQPAYDLVVVDDQFEDHVERCARGQQQVVQRLRLRNVARKPVEQEALRGVVLGQPVTHHAHGDLVGNEVAGVHE